MFQKRFSTRKSKGENMFATILSDLISGDNINAKILEVTRIASFWQFVRVVKEKDLKSFGLCPRRFESCSCRVCFYFCFFFVLCFCLTYPTTGLARARNLRLLTKRRQKHRCIDCYDHWHYPTPRKLVRT